MVQEDTSEFKPNQSTAKREDTVLRPRSDLAFFTLLAGVLVTFMMVILILNTPTDFFDFVFLIFIVFVLIIIPILTIKTKLKRLVFNQKGLKFHGLFKAYFWKWSDLGAFSAKRCAGLSYLCADTSADKMISDASVLLQSDVAIGLTLYDLGGDHPTIGELVAHLNKMREEFGSKSS